MSKKLYALDTNVLIVDPMAIFKFEDNDILITSTVLEEIDKHKKGNDDLARNAREFSRQLESIISKASQSSKDDLGFKYNIGDENSGFIYLEGLSTKIENVKDHLLSTQHNGAVNDNVILLSVYEANDLKLDYEKIVLVSKDINMRIKARSIGLHTEDYESDKSLQDNEVLPKGYEFIRKFNLLKSYNEDGSNKYFFELQEDMMLFINQFVGIDGIDGEYQVEKIEDKFITVKSTVCFRNNRSVWGLNARNSEQNQALNLLLDPEIHFVTLLGPAGTGKTILTLAAALEQIIDENQYDELIMTRATVSVGEEIGFLPGTEEEKMNPWMGALHDNLEALGVEKETASNEIVMKKIKVKSMSFMRGRSFQGRYLILDEAQNLTPKQIKTLVTRAGEGTKVICMGNLSQIDSPYISASSSGLTHAVIKLKDWKRSGHLILTNSVRSELAEIAEEML